MNREELIHQIKSKRSCLCVGLDTDIDRIPSHLLKSKDPLFEFNRQIIDATHAYAIAYKPNLAFYEQLGPRGMESLTKTIEYLPKDVLSIADAKRGDIGNTAHMYAKAFFESFGFDSITVSPYMGLDSLEPFLSYADKWTIVLGLTSNPGHHDVQRQVLKEGGELYEKVMHQCTSIAGPDQLMFVTGATHPKFLKAIRSNFPDYFFLVPGVGAQGGTVEEVMDAAATDFGGVLINSSRGIIYAGDGKDFATKAALEAKKLQEKMAVYL